MEVIKGLAAAKINPDGRGLRIGIVTTRWNETIIAALRQGAIDELNAHLGLAREYI